MTRATVEKIAIYPIKSCAEVVCQKAVLTTSGFENDRAFLLVKENGIFLSQRDRGAEKLALVQPKIEGDIMIVSAPGMSASLRVPLDLEEDANLIEFSIHKELCRGFHLGAHFDLWFSEYIGLPIKLVRFDPAFERISNPFFVGEVQVRNLANDGFPIHTLSRESVEILNRRLIERGAEAVSSRNFRSNILLSGLGPFGEDFYSKLLLKEKGIELHNVKPCSRCGVVNINQVVGSKMAGETTPLRLLSELRTLFDARGQKASMFGQNTIVSNGIGGIVEVGDSFAAIEGPTGFRPGQDLIGLFLK